MKIAFAAPIIFAIAACAHPQVGPTPPVATCPTATVGGTAYTPLNPPANNTTAASITGTSSTDTPGVGTFCYIVQSWAIVAPATVYQDSGPSNVVMATTTASLTQVNLSWTGTAGYTYIVSRAPATVVPAPIAPTLSTPSTVANLLKAPGNLAVRAGL